MKKTTFVKNLLYVLCFSALVFNQSLKAQVVIGAPNLGFTQACANDGFNIYYVTFMFSPETALSSSNQFIIELSDPDGNFSNTNPNQVYISNAGEITSSPATVGFPLPTDTAGETYRIRIKSTAPAATSSGSTSFPAYYKVQDSPFSINNLISTASYCAGGSYLLTIDNPGIGTNDSPLNYPQLTYKWYKETGPTSSVFVSDGESLAVSTPGIYFVETNYGSCTSDSYSNRVTVTESTSGGTTTIVSSLGNPFCPDSGATTLSTSSGSSYQWYLNGQIISGATEQTFDTEISGNYSVQVNFGGCTATASIDLVSEMFTSSLNVDAENTIDTGDTLDVLVTTTADNPEFLWYLNNTLISGVTGNTYQATQEGNYMVVINQTTGCLVSNELFFEIIEEADPEHIPNLISPNGDGINDTWVIPQEYVRGSNTQVLIMDSYGKIVLNTDKYDNDWPQNELKFTSVNPVYYYVITQENKTKKGSITIVK